MVRVSWVALALSLVLSTPGGATQSPEAEATKAADAWLALVDQAKYLESWEGAAPMFQAAVSKDRWNGMVSSLRGPLGKVESRTLVDAKYMTSVPGAPPDGKYVVIQYSTTFENREGAVETVTPMQDEDGRWKVSGYFVR